jgi:hypothetical protein
MRRRWAAGAAMAMVLGGGWAAFGGTMPAAPRAFVGFDRNDYPGDELLEGLRKDFAFMGYWLNAPPGETASSWLGKRALLRERGFGFLVLFNGRADAELKGRDAAGLGRADAGRAAALARSEGFPAGAVVFLDQEEGGRLLPEQMAYVLAWVDGMRRAGWRPGVYCSGIEVPDGGDATISTAEQIIREAGSWKIALWVAREQCPPSPGCVVWHADGPGDLGLPGAEVWQYAQSPRRMQFTAGCAQGYSADNQCYAPSLPHGARTMVDLDSAESPDPSHGR